MVWWVPLAAAAVSAAGSMAAAKSSKSNTPTQQTTSSGTVRGTPHPGVEPALSFLSGNAMNLAQRPVPYFPGQSYVSPSGLTQSGIGMGREALPHYRTGANLTAAASPYYQRGAKLTAAASPYYEAAARQAALGEKNALMAIPGQHAINREAMDNYRFLSNAADIAQNPYVQGMLDVNQERLSRNFTEDILPALRGSALQVNALGSGRLGLAQGRAAGDVSQAIADANRQTMLQAYSQGLGAQQAALGQTGNMLQNQLASAQTREYAARMSALAGGLQGQAGQTQTQAAGMMGQAGMAEGQAAGMLGQGAASALGMGQTIEEYQRRALQDAMARYAYQWQEPQARMESLQRTAAAFQPYGGTVTQGTQTAPNPNYLSPVQAGIGGASFGWGVGNQLNNWWGQQQAAGATPARTTTTAGP